MMADKTPIWVAEVRPDWTALEILASGDVFAFNRATGRVYKVPHPDVPIIIYAPKTTPIPYDLTDAGREALK